MRFCLAPIGFPWMVYEITTGSRLASPVSTDAVETCHPLCSCGPRIGAAPDSFQRKQHKLQTPR